MPRWILGGVVGVVLASVVAMSRSDSPSSPVNDRGLKIDSAAKNPWTAKPVNNDNQNFQFAVVSDRTGGHRAKVFSQAVERINLLQPEFVMSVGDLI
ncbi:MAG: hypothetical protein ACRCZF_02985, partial [Gemmataceae bacterium]